MKNRVFIVIPNWNGAKELPTAVDSLLAQTYNDFSLVIVDNGSTDNSRELIEAYQARDARVRSIYRDKNYGFTGGVNPGMELAIQEDAEFVALFNNDAKADKHWLESLLDFMQNHAECGIVTCKLLHMDGKTIDSTGDQYSIWGLPFPRGRNEPTSDRYDNKTTIFGASGGASMYRVAALREVGIFDDDYFAYYEDIDLSFRHQLAGWKVGYAPRAHVYHEQGTTSARMKDFTIYQSFKNFPMVIVKNIPKGLLHRIVPRFLLSYGAFFVSAIRRGKIIPALRGIGAFLRLIPKKLRQRHHIQSTKKVDAVYMWSMLLHDLPPDQKKLIKLRAFWWRIRGRRV